MISWIDLYNVLSNVVPLYVVLILAYGSVKWWKIFSPEECLGINRFVALFAVPLLTIKFISNNNPYAMNLKFIAADTLQKLVVIVILFLWYKLSSRGSLEWCITLFSLSTIPNTIVVGIPLLGGMYDKDLSQSLMVQLSVIQFNIWFPVLLFLFEYRRATLLIFESESGSESKCTTHEMMSAINVSSSRECSKNDDCSETLNGFDEEKEMGVISVLPSELTNSSEINAQVAARENPDDSDQQQYGGNACPTGSRSTIKGNVQHEIADHSESKHKDVLPVASVTTRLILIMVCKKLMRNPNFYSSLFALTWSLISFRWHVNMPAIVANSIKIFSDTGLGMAMFSLGLFMASQPRIIAGGGALAALATTMRFIVGPAITAATSTSIGLRGTLLQIIIMQAALPQAIITFVFAQEYNVNPGVLSTAVSFGMLISLPITLVYYILLGIAIK